MVELRGPVEERAGRSQQEAKGWKPGDHAPASVSL